MLLTRTTDTTKDHSGPPLDPRELFARSGNILPRWKRRSWLRKAELQAGAAKAAPPPEPLAEAA